MRHHRRSEISLCASCTNGALEYRKKVLKALLKCCSQIRAAEKQEEAEEEITPGESLLADCIAHCDHCGCCRRLRRAAFSARPFRREVVALRGSPAPESSTAEPSATAGELNYLLIFQNDCFQCFEFCSIFHPVHALRLFFVRCSVFGNKKICSYVEK